MAVPQRRQFSPVAGLSWHEPLRDPYRRRSAARGRGKRVRPTPSGQRWRRGALGRRDTTDRAARNATRAARLFPSSGSGSWSRSLLGRLIRRLKLRLWFHRGRLPWQERTGGHLFDDSFDAAEIHKGKMQQGCDKLIRLSGPATLAEIGLGIETLVRACRPTRTTSTGSFPPCQGSGAAPTA